MSRFAKALALVLLSASAVFGQAVAIGSISGAVTDPTGGSVPGATVRATETLKGTVHTVNHGNWNNPSSTVSSATTFGQVTSFGAPRIIQMAMKVYF